MLTGQRAFQRESRMKTLAAVLNDDPRTASDLNETVPAEVDRLLARCLRKDPQRRWQTISDLKVALQDMKEDSESGKLPAAGRSASAKKRPAAPVLAGAFLLLAIAGAAVLLKLFVFKPAKSEATYQTTRLTFDSGLTVAPALSPDGKMVAYASDREGDGTLDLWVQQVSGGKPLRLTDHPGNDWFPDFSPDGTKIVFRSERDGGGIYVIDVLGGDARRIANTGFAPRYSPDGSLVAYVIVPASLESRLFDLYLVPAKGGAPRPFHPEFRINSVHQGAAPVWSPDGKALLFSGALDADPASSDWWVLPIDGGEPVRTRAVSNLALPPATLYPGVWLGTNVYFVYGTTIEGMNVFRVPIDPKSWTISGPAIPVTNGPGMKITLSAARDGRIVYANVTAVIDAWGAAARPDDAFVSTDFRKITQDTMQKFNPSISRDGTKLAFTAFGGLQGGRLEVRWRDLSSGRETILPLQGLTPNFGQNPRLSPDGALLAFRDFLAGKWRTFVVPTGSTSGTDVGEIGRVLDFFADPNFVLVQSKPTELSKRNLKTGESTSLFVLAAGFLNDGSLSPDNKWVAFRTGLPDGRASISVVPIGGQAAISAVPAGAGAASAKDVVPLIVSDHYLSNPRWSPNGRYVYYLSEKSGRCGLYAQKLDPRTKKPVGDAQAVFFSSGERINLNYPKGNGFIDVAADKIVFTVDEVAGNIFLVTPVVR
jgi:Tol biopolymer transport system component